MTELFKTVLLLSGFGSFLVLLMLCLKPLMTKRFPAQWQFVCWVLVAVLALVPIYKLVPEKATEALPLTQQVLPNTTLPDGILATEPPPSLHPTVKVESAVFPLKQKVSLWAFLPLVWLGGFLAFSLFLIISYSFFLLKKRNGSESFEETDLLTEVKEKLHIRRYIRVRKSDTVGSPLLVGFLFPVVYLPKHELSEEQLRMVYLHELTHFKRGDLLFKWLALLANAIHWFNPLFYLLSNNLSASCEVACDMSVTKDMDVMEQNRYMKTILDLLEQKEESDV